MWLISNGRRAMTSSNDDDYSIKIIREGQPSRVWWLNKKHECAECGQIIQFGLTAQFANCITAFNGKRIEYSCKFCGTMNEIRKEQ
jgi:hypothetical protein